jgi:hypothetical protein
MKFGERYLFNKLSNHNCRVKYIKKTQYNSGNNTTETSVEADIETRNRNVGGEGQNK